MTASFARSIARFERNLENGRRLELCQAVQTEIDIALCKPARLCVADRSASDIEPVTAHRHRRRQGATGCAKRAIQKESSWCLWKMWKPQARRREQSRTHRAVSKVR
jgi:hypothetical protein